MNIAIIMMGGSGTRFGASIPKQFIDVGGKPVFAYLLEAYELFEEVDAVYIVCHQDWIDFTEDWARRLGVAKLKGVITGGSSRSQSLQFGLEVASEIASLEDVIAVHDVTHPFLDERNVRKCLEIARNLGASTLVGSCYDTMYFVDGASHIDRVASRELLVSATSPECFRFDVIAPLYRGKDEKELAAMTSAGAMLVANGYPVQVVRTPLINLKITLHEDMDAFVRLMHGYYYAEDAVEA